MNLINRDSILKESIAVVKYLVKLQASSCYADDLVSEVLVILCEIPEDKLIYLYTRGELLRYTAGIIKNQYNSKTSLFYKKYKKYNTLRQDLDVVEDTNDD